MQFYCLVDKCSKVPLQCRALPSEPALNSEIMLVIVLQIKARGIDTRGGSTSAAEIMLVIELQIKARGIDTRGGSTSAAACKQQRREIGNKNDVTQVSNCNHWYNY